MGNVFQSDVAHFDSRQEKVLPEEVAVVSKFDAVRIRSGAGKARCSIPQLERVTSLKLKWLNESKRKKKSFCDLFFSAQKIVKMLPPPSFSPPRTRRGSAGEEV